MKANNPNRNLLLLACLIVLLGFSKSWFMTAEGLSGIDLAETSASDDGPDVQRVKLGAEPRTGAAAQPNCAAIRDATAKAKCVANTKDKKPVVKDKEGKGVSADPAAEKQKEKDALTIEKNKSTVQDKVLAGMKNVPLNKTITITKAGTKVSYQITDVSTVAMNGKTVVWTDHGAETQDTTTTSLVATIKCLTCDGAEETLTSNAANPADFIKDLNDQLLTAAKEAADAEKAEKALKKAQDACEKDDDGKKLNEEHQLVCLAKKDMDDDSRDRVDSLREDVEDDVLDMIQDGPDGIRKAKKLLKSIRMEVGGDSASKKYISKLNQFATDYGRVASLARDSSLNPMDRLNNFNEITQIAGGYQTTGMRHSDGTQSYLDNFDSIMMSYARQAQTSPYNAYNSFYNQNGSLLGNNAVNYNGTLGLSGMGNGPAGFQATGYGPNGMTTAPANYLGGMNGLNSTSPFGLRQSSSASRPTFGPGYLNGGISGT